jgi:hypothetical protein
MYTGLHRPNRRFFGFLVFTRDVLAQIFTFTGQYFSIPLSSVVHSQCAYQRSRRRPMPVPLPDCMQPSRTIGTSSTSGERFFAGVFQCSTFVECFSRCQLLLFKKYVRCPLAVYVTMLSLLEIDRSMY